MMMITCQLVLSVLLGFSVITFTSLQTNMHYVVLHVTFSQSITKITETEKIQKLKLNRTEMNLVKLYRNSNWFDFQNWNITETADIWRSTVYATELRQQNSCFSSELGTLEDDGRWLAHYPMKDVLYCLPHIIISATFSLQNEMLAILAFYIATAKRIKCKNSCHIGQI